MWIANPKDRTPLLIDGASANAAAAKPSKPKAPVKTAAAKRAVATKKAMAGADAAVAAPETAVAEAGA